MKTKRAMKASVAAVIGLASLALLGACQTPTNPQQTDEPDQEPGDEDGRAYLAPSVERAPAPAGLRLAPERGRLG